MSYGAYKPVVIRHYSLFQHSGISVSSQRDILMELFTVVIVKNQMRVVELDIKGYIAIESIDYFKKYCHELTIVLISFMNLCITSLRAFKFPFFFFHYEASASVYEWTYPFVTQERHCIWFLYFLAPKVFSFIGLSKNCSRMLSFCAPDKA